MCEFIVYLDGKKVMEDVVYAHTDSDKVTIKDIIGESKTFEGVRLVEVNVISTSLIIESELK